MYYIELYEQVALRQKEKVSLAFNALKSAKVQIQ